METNDFYMIIGKLYIETLRLSAIVQQLQSAQGSPTEQQAAGQTPDNVNAEPQ